MHTNNNYKFDNYSFTENIKYYKMIEKMNEIIKATKATGKTTNCSTKDKKFKSKTVKYKNGKSKKCKCTYCSITNYLVEDCYKC